MKPWITVAADQGRQQGRQIISVSRNRMYLAISGGIVFQFRLHRTTRTMRKAHRQQGESTLHALTDHSLLGKFRTGEQDAATQLYLRYAGRLQAWASSQTSAALTPRFDEEDIVQSVFRTLFRRVSEGLYDVPDGDELWQLLLVIALNKIRKLATFHRAQKRDVGKTLGTDALEVVGEQSRSKDETSLHVLQMVVDELLCTLPESQRAIVELRMEGHKTNDIAELTDRSSRTVERVLQGFRRQLSALLDVGPQFS